MGYTVDQLQAGQTASFSKTISENDVYTFAGVTGDLNPAHINEPFAQQTQFHGRIAHGMLSAGPTSAAIGMQPPGPTTPKRQPSRPGRRQTTPPKSPPITSTTAAAM